MDDFIKTSEMDLGPVRVPVMMKKNVADRLAQHILTRGYSDYDATMENIILAGLEATGHKVGKAG